MNILVDIRPLMDERYSGVSEFTLALLQALFSVDTENRYFLFYNSFHDIKKNLPDFSQPNVTFVSRRFPNRIFNHGLQGFLRWPRLDRLAGEKIDIFFIPHLNFTAWSPQVPSVITVHDLSFFQYPEFFSPRQNFWHLLLRVKGLLRRATTVIGVSESTRSDIIERVGIFSEQVQTIHSGVSADFRPLPTDDPKLSEIRKKYSLTNPFIFFLGTIEPRKNISGLIEAFELLKAEGKFPELELVIAGGHGWKARPIYKRARMSKCSAQIRFLDYVPSEDKVFLYNLATVFAYPSFYEGFGFPPLEAMACGTPTIAGTGGALPEIVGDGAILVDPYNSTALATALESVLTDADLRKSLTEASLKRAQSFDWNNTAREYLRIFTKLYEKSKLQA